MGYYLVTAKCGHVGKGKYREVDFPIIADSKKEAAQRCLTFPKVKRHLKNAISGVIEITSYEYNIKKEENSNDVYIRSHTKREILDLIQLAKELPHKRKHKYSFESREERILFVMRKNKDIIAETEKNIISY